MGRTLRFFDPLDIHYIVYVPAPPASGSPWETTGLEQISSILFFLPHNYMQIFHPFEHSASVFCSLVCDLKLSFVHSYESFIEIISTRKNKINVLIMAERNDNIVAEAINSREDIFFIYNKNIGISIDISYVFDSPYALSQKLLSKRDEIVSWFRDNVSGDMPIEEILNIKLLEDDLDFYDFNPSFPLTAYINGFLGKMWDKRLEKVQTIAHDKRAETLLALLKKCDNVSLIGAYYLGQKNIPAHPIFIYAPFFDSSYRKAFKGVDNDLCVFLGTEQNFNYEYPFSSELQKKADKHPHKNLIAHSIKQRKINDMQIGAYLHASLSFSPLLRLPEKGKIFSNILAEYKNGKSPSINKNTLRLKKFGRMLSENLLLPGLKEYLLGIERQIVFVSDLPIEWASINDVPIGFLFDICRLPSNPTRLLNSFTYNSIFSYSIDKSTLTNHLIITSDDGDIKNYSAGNFQKTLAIKINQTNCKSFADVVSAVKNYNPHLLFFDCHGGFDEKSSLSYLCFGNDKITYREIIGENISAPLVVLSCCCSSPVASLNAIADAFLAAGAFAVLATTHPIGLVSGSVIVSRIIKNLEYAVTHCVHSNWLNFISHVLRTSIHHQYCSEITRRTGIRENPISVGEDSLTDPRVIWRSQTMDFSKRIQSYNGLKESVAKCFPPDKGDEIAAALNTIPPPCEFLYYSHLGRPDLVYFQNYLDEHKFIMPVDR